MTEAMPPLAKIFQVYYDERTKKELNGQFIPYFNPNCTKYFESQVIADLYDQGQFTGAPYVGVVSWRIAQKVRPLPDFETFIAADNGAHDFYYMGRSAVSSVWQNYAPSHGGTIDFHTHTQALLKELGIEVELLQLETVSSYCNYQICKAELYQDYVSNFLKPMLALMEDKSRTELQAWLNTPTPYTKLWPGPVSRLLDTPLGRHIFGFLRRCDSSLIRSLPQLLSLSLVDKNAVPVTQLEKITGFPYYTKHAFIAERLFPTWAAVKGWKGKRFS